MQIGSLIYMYDPDNDNWSVSGEESNVQNVFWGPGTTAIQFDDTFMVAGGRHTISGAFTRSVFRSAVQVTNTVWAKDNFSPADSIPSF